MLRTLKSLQGFELGATDGIVGKVKDYYFDDQDWAVRYLVADTGNWLLGRQVLISPAAITLPEENIRVLSTRLSRKQIEESPSVEEAKPVSRQHEMAYSDYYGWPAYWEGPYLWGGVTAPTYPPSAETLAQQRTISSPGAGPEMLEPKGDPRLRSWREVLGYHMQARDGEIGHIVDFLCDDRTWTIRYLILDTRNWWPGRKVVLSPAWIEGLNWEHEKVAAKVLRADVIQAPEYESEMNFTEDFQRKLNEYYENTLRYQA